VLQYVWILRRLSRALQRFRVPARVRVVRGPAAAYFDGQTEHFNDLDYLDDLDHPYAYYNKHHERIAHAHHHLVNDGRRANDADGAPIWKSSDLDQWHVRQRNYVPRCHRSGQVLLVLLLLRQRPLILWR
jgi:hypothetical protein